MRIPVAALLLIFALRSPLFSGTDVPTVQAAFTNTTVPQNTAIPALDLTATFSVPGVSGRLVQFVTPGIGTFNVQTDATAAPATVANFLSYVNANRFTSSSIVHRTDKALGVIQGGGFYIDTANSQLAGVVANAPIALEGSDTLENVRGSIAMANGGAPNTTTSEWFINVADNSTGLGGHYLPSASNGGYAVFGSVIGTGMNVVDAIFAKPVLGGNVTVTNSSLSSKTVTISTVGVPANFGAGWTLLGSQVQSVSGATVTLAANATTAIGAATSVPYTLLGSPFTQLPVFTNLVSAASPLFFSNLIALSSIQEVTLFPTTLAVNVTSCTTTSSVVGVATPVPANFHVGSRFLGTTVTGIIGAQVFLKNNADRNISTTTAVPASIIGEVSVVSFTLTNTNPSLVAATISGSALNLSLRTNRGGFADIAVNATDSNGNSAQSKFRLTVTGGLVNTSNPKDANNDGLSDFVFQNNAGQLHEWLLDGTGNAINFSTGAGLKPGQPPKFLYSGGLGDFRLMGRADVNNDGIPDLVFQNTAGQIYVWFLDGSGNTLNFSTGAGLKPGQPPKFLYSGGLGDYRIVACTDLNGDGFADIVFQNSAGQIYVWFLDGSGNTINFSTGAGLKTGMGPRFLYSGGLGDYRIVACTDLNGDGFADIVFQNSAGQIYVWFLDGSGNTINFSTGAGLRTGMSPAFLYAGGLGDFRIVACTDLNGDGAADIVFQNTAGQIYAWFLDGTGSAVNFSTGAGFRIGVVAAYLYSYGLADWRIR